MKKTFLSLLLGSLLASQLIGCAGNTPASAQKENEAVTESTIDTGSETTSEAVSEETSEAEGETPSETVSETTSETGSETASEAESETSSEQIDASKDIYVGNWYERYAQRGYMEITKEDDVYYFQINWAGSASENYCWTFSASENEAGVIAYNNCTKVLITWDENDDESEEVLEENASGSVYIKEDGTLIWNEHDDMPEPNEFVKE